VEERTQVIDERSVLAAIAEACGLERGLVDIDRLPPLADELFTKLIEKSLNGANSRPNECNVSTRLGSAGIAASSKAERRTAATAMTQAIIDRRCSPRTRWAAKGRPLRTPPAARRAERSSIADI
jgi:hypothetical protein